MPPEGLILENFKLKALYPYYCEICVAVSKVAMIDLNLADIHDDSTAKLFHCLI